MRLSFVVQGVVQGVGFRPFVRKSALALGLTGWVRNGRGGVQLEVQGPDAAVDAFGHALEHGLPPSAVVQRIERTRLEERLESSFEIIESEGGEMSCAPVLPADLALCAACARDVEDPRDRRFRYPFTNCTGCGPRFTIVRALPYDRAKTSMDSFAMCPECRREYEDLNDRRYHAQPVACPRCGPQLSWLDASGDPRASKESALAQALDAIARGDIVAVRGVGGFQLMALATDPRPLAMLRERKRRPTKPFAVMFRDAAAVAVDAELGDAERVVLGSPEAPIVLLRRRERCRLDDLVAPECPYVGAMLPSTPLHKLLLDGLGVPVVCTSGNLSDEPICTTTAEAVERLSRVADGFLTHDREVLRPMDDSLVRGGAVIRRARGYAPRALGTVRSGVTALGVGAYLKSTVTLAHAGKLVPSQHLGDLDSSLTRDLLARTADDLCAFLGAQPEVVACDLHPDYPSTWLAQTLVKRWGARLLRVQHHHAHVAAVLAEHEVQGQVLGLAWDGTGYGSDGTLWGGEALVVEAGRARRIAHLRPMRLPGGERAARDPRRCALGALTTFLPAQLDRAREWFGDELPAQVAVMDRGLAPWSSSAGRLFDAVAALVGVSRGPVSFEGEAAAAIEYLAERASPSDGYVVELDADGVADPSPMLTAILADVDRRVSAEIIARRFHDGLVNLGCAMARRAGLERVVLSGGCFQNALLLRGLTGRLEREGFQVLLPLTVPANDGGISVGQAWIACT